MKKLGGIIVTLGMLLSLSLVGCGGTEDDAANSAANDPATAQAGPENQGQPASELETNNQESGDATSVQPAGFGCPLNAYECDRHCVSKGRTGGYCGGWLRATCYCYY